MRLDRVIPSMFHRRLLLLLGVVGCAFGVLALQMGRLTVVQGAQHRAEMERRLVSRTWMPTVRGRILDRKGRVLAHDRPTLDVAVDFRVLTGEWAVSSAARGAWRLHRQEWPSLTREQREELRRRYLPRYEAHVEAMWREVGEATGVGYERVIEGRDAVLGRIEGVYESVLRARWRRELEEELSSGRRITPGVEDEIERRVKGSTGRPFRIRQQDQPHVVLPRVSDEVGFALMRQAAGRARIVLVGPDGEELVESVDALPGLTVVNAGDREYPFDRMTVKLDRATLPGAVGGAGAVRLDVEGVGLNVIGWMRERMQREDVEARDRALAADPELRARAMEDGMDRGWYRDEDAVGASGVERSAEHSLRGLRGLVRQNIETGERGELAAQAGHDVRLTLDVMLQARIQAVMSPEFGLASVQEWQFVRENPTMPVGTPLHGAAVVLEIDTGDILAMVSTPGVSREALRERAGALYADSLNFPLIDRTIGRPYPPGSIAKAMVLAGATTLGKHALDRPISCTGHLYPDRPEMYRCWIYKDERFRTTHDAYLGHAPDAREAMMISCNIFFFTLGQRLGSEGMVRAYTMFGVGEPLGLGAGAEYPGQIGTMRAGRASPPSASEAVLTAIGQGPVAWTPLHAADAYATLARGGVRVRPRVVMGNGPPETIDLGLDGRGVAEALEGLRLAVNDPRGTGHHITIDGVQHAHFNLPGVQVWGKTGTADAPRLRGDPDGDGPLPEQVREGDHSWFVVLAGPSGGGPRYAIAVMMEYAGSGGRVSGPIINQVIRALVAEGYL